MLLLSYRRLSQDDWNGLRRQCVVFVVCDYYVAALDLRDSLPSRHAPKGSSPASKPSRPLVTSVYVSGLPDFKASLC